LTLSDFSRQVWQLLERHLLSEPERNNQFASNLREFYGTDVFKCANQACPLSVKGFSTASARDLHNKCHERPYKCNDASCEYSKLGFYTANALTKHANIHFNFDAAVENISNLNINMAPETLSQQSDPADLLLDALDSDDANQFQLVLANGALDINRQIDGESLLCRAVKRGSIDIVRLLLQVGADFNLRDKWGNRPLLLASSSPEITKLLLEYGSDVHAKGYLDGTTLVMSKSIDVSQVLLEYGARIDASNKRGETALIHAISEGRIDQARFLLERGANVNTKANYGTPLAVAACSGRVDYLQLLLEYGADVNMKDEHGITPLGATCMSGYYTDHGPPRSRALALKALLEAGADPTVPSRKPVKGYAFIKKLPQYIDMTWEELVEATRSKRLTSSHDSSYQNSLD
jgi:ankyrin repeat protein